MESMPFLTIPLHSRYGLGKVAKVDGDYDGEYLSSYRWYVSKEGYVYRIPSRFEKRGTSRIYLHHEVHGKPKNGYVVDHINHDKSDNRSCNLRFITRSKNSSIKVYSKVGKHGFTGLKHVQGGRKNKDGSRWTSKRFSYLIPGTVKVVGSYETAEEAARARDEHIKLLYPDPIDYRVMLNFPENA